MCAVAKQLIPFGSVDDGETVEIGRDGREPVVEDDMVLRCDGSGVEVENQWNGGGMILAQAHVGVARGARFPARELLAILHGLIKDIDRTSPNMAILEFGMRPAALREEIMRWETGGWIRHVIVEEHCVFDGERPEFGISNVGPVDGCMKEHGSCNGHHGLDRAFCNAVMMMSTNTGEAWDLSELSKVSLIFSWGKCAPIVTQVFLWNYSIVATMVLVGFLCLDGLVGVQMNLMRDEDITGGVVDEDGSSRELLLFLFFAVSRRESSSGWAHEMVDWYSLSCMKDGLFEFTLLVLDDWGLLSRGRTTFLFPILTSSAERMVSKFSSVGLKTTSTFAVSKNAASHEELNLLPSEMPKAMVPSK
jgi:hypothetical protein